MKTDSIFYRLFQEFPGIFFELIGEPPQAVNAYRFSSVEVSRFSQGETLRERSNSKVKSQKSKVRTP